MDFSLNSTDDSKDEDYQPPSSSPKSKQDAEKAKAPQTKKQKKTQKSTKISSQKPLSGPALDNAGATCRVNCGSCRSPLGRRLLTVIADALWTSNSDIIADWNNREHPLSQHADDLNKILTVQDVDEPPWIFDLMIQGGSLQKTVKTSIRIPRLGESLPDYLRHLGQAYRKKLNQH